MLAQAYVDWRELEVIISQHEDELKSLGKEVDFKSVFSLGCKGKLISREERARGLYRDYKEDFEWMIKESKSRSTPLMIETS